MLTFHNSSKPLGKAANLGVATVLAVSCCAAKPQLKAPLAEPPATIMQAKWADGRCSFDRVKNTLTYDKKGHTASFKLDQVITEPERIFCANDHTAILTGNLLVVTLGADAVFEGREWIGSYGNHMTMANCYFLYVDEMKAEGVQNAGRAGATLWFTTAAGNRWIMSFSQPEDWKIIHK
jgi:hypothetical protein